MTSFIINILVIFGISVLFSDGMLLNPVKKYLQLRINKNVLKPLILCPPCMASVWGTIGFLFQDYPIYYLPVYCLALSGAIYLIMQFMPE